VVTVNYGGHRASYQVTRGEFELMTRDLVQQCAETCTIVLERARLRWADIDDILFAGGSTKMPMIHALIRQLSGRDPVAGVNPDECVACGAALTAVFRHRPQHPAIIRRSGSLGHALAGIGEVPRAESRPLGLSSGVSIVDVASHPLGIMALNADGNEQVVTLIQLGSTLPAEKRRRFAYAYDGLTAIRVEVTEGTGDSRDEVTVIGEVILDNLPPRPRGTPIDVIYRYTVNNILEVDVIDVETRAARKARIALKGGLDPTEMALARKKVAIALVS
jgi:molecular chaperone DnaK